MVSISSRPLKCTCGSCQLCKHREYYRTNKVAIYARKKARRVLRSEETKEKERAYQRQWYHSHKDSARLRANKIARKKRYNIKEFVNTLKAEKGCSLCNERDHRCLDFHHTDPTTKKLTIACAVRSGYSPKTIVDEIQKCVVLCANCHRKQHSKV